MNFFEAQERAKTRTGRLLGLFVLAVAGTVLALYAALLLALRQPWEAKHASLELWDPKLFGLCALGVGLVVGVCSLFRWLEFKAGGAHVARMMGGRQILSATQDPLERRLRNVVEEMAIASGVPIPAIFVLDGEEGINAFAAGLQPDDAAVAVTRGTLEQLNRDELQAVVGHEFSHILNGDMRLNLRIGAVLFGILALGIIGKTLLRSLRHVPIARSRGRNGKGGDPRVFIAVLGLILLVIGYVGHFLGRLIQAAVSRQREFLADASAVQFTRNPEAVAGALRRIGGLSAGSRLTDEKKPELRHLLFSEACSGMLGSLSTHPPLPERIRAVLPSWDGSWLKARARNENLKESREREEEDFPGMPAAFAAAATPPPLPLDTALPYLPAQVVAQAGQLTERHFEQARQLVGRIPLVLQRAARDADQAAGLLRTLLGHAETGNADWEEALTGLAAEFRIPLVQLCLPALKSWPANQRVDLVSELHRLAQTDGQISPFEFALLAMVAKGLSPRPPGGNAFTGIHSFQAVAEEIRVLLSTLAWVETEEEAEALRALANGYALLKILEPKAGLLPRSACSTQALFLALEKLGRGTLPIRKRFLDAAAHVIGDNGSVSVEEAELLRAMALALDCPLPLWDGVAPETA